MPSHIYRPAWWIPGAHAQTLWGKLLPRWAPFPSRRERWDTPDGDFVDLVRVDAPAGSPRLLVLHGLEGSARSHYVRGTLSEFHRRGWAADLLIFRSCGDEPNRARRLYHSGETSDLAFVIDRLTAQDPDVPLCVAGFSLGGNVLLKFLGERGTTVPHQLRAAAAVSVPFDLERGSRSIERGFSRVYSHFFVRALRRKAAAKLVRFPDLIAPGTLEGVRTLYDFDDRVTAPVHGFASAHDYYSRSSSLGWLGGIRVPTLLLNAMDDPFLPPDVLGRVRELARDIPALELEFVEHGGHVGFVSGRVPWRARYYAESRIADFLEGRLARKPALPSRP